MLKAIADRIIVKLDSITESTILLPEEHKKCHNKGTVQSVGPLVKLVKKGDHIVFHPFDELSLPQPDSVVIRESSVLAVYEDE